MSEQVKNMFASIAHRYDLLNHLLSFNIDKSWRKKTIRLFRKKTDHSPVFLDLCAGTLDLTIELAKEFPTATIYAVDFCQPMLVSGKHKINTKDLDRIFLCCADGLKLPFKDHKFDAIFCGYGYRNLDDPLIAGKELKRVLKNSGELFILDFFKPVKKMTKLFHSTYGRYVLPLLGSVVAANKDAYVYLNKSVDGFLTTDETETMLKKAGFKKTNSADLFMGISSIVSASN